MLNMLIAPPGYNGIEVAQGISRRQHVHLSQGTGRDATKNAQPNRGLPLIFPWVQRMTRMDLTRLRIAILGVGLVACFALLVGCASSSTEQLIDAAATSTTPAPDTTTDWDAKSGLLIIGVRAFGMTGRDQVNKDPAVLTGISIKNMETNAVYNIALHYDSAVKVVPSGSYCINSFRTYWNVELDYCRDPMFSILAGQATNLGYVFVGVNYRGGPNSIRFWPYSLYKYKRELSKNLTASEHKLVQDFIEKSRPNHPGVDDTVWYSYDQGGNTFAFWFNKGGDFFFQPNPGSIFRSGHQGTWKIDGDKISFALEQYDRYYQGTVSGSFISGTAWDSKDGSKWVWFATKDPTVQPSYNDSAQARVVYQDSTPYPKDALDKRITGFVRIHYKLPLPEEGLSDITPTVAPVDLHVVESQPSGVFDKAALEAFRYAFYANAVKDGKPVESEGEETISYQIVNGKPVVTYSTKLEPLTPPKTK